MTELCDRPALELRRLIGAKEISPVELLQSCLARVERVNGTVNALVTDCFQRAHDEAQEAEAAVMAGDPLGLLHGLPIGIKDLEATAGVRTTLGSLLYEDFVPQADQGSVASVREEGAIVVGKTNSPEFGAGANTRNRMFGATGNPFDPEKTCAGSSGGSAVALATGMVPIASGSDYGGSLRSPASFCGVVGFRPSPGLVPSEAKPVGLSPFSVLGPMARTVADAALLLAAQIDVDRRDPFSAVPDPDLFQPLGDVDLARVRAAISVDLGFAPVSTLVRETFADRTGRFRHVFAEAQDRDLPFTDELHDAFEVLRGVAFVAAHAERVENHRDLLGANVVDNVERGMAYTLPDVARAHVVQSETYRAYLAMFDEVDVVICPGASVSPFPHAELSVEEIDGERMPTYMRWLALPYGLTMVSAPVCCIPCGLDPNGMPFGIQVAGAPGTDRFVLEVAHALERVLAQDPATARPLPDLAKLTG